MTFLHMSCLRVILQARGRDGMSTPQNGSGSRFADSWRSRRSKPTSDDERLDVTAEVDRCGGVVDLIRQSHVSLICQGGFHRCLPLGFSSSCP